MNAPTLVKGMDCFLQTIHLDSLDIWILTPTRIEIPTLRLEFCRLTVGQIVVYSNFKYDNFLSNPMLKYSSMANA